MLACAIVAPTNMKLSLYVTVAVLIATLSTSSCCFPQNVNAKDAGSAKHFVDNLYAQYGRSTDPPNLFEGTASQAFTPSLIKLARTDAKAAKPDVGVLDYDPVCNCQDPDVKFPDLKITIESANADRATAVVQFTTDNTPNKLVLTLARKENDWRIFNIKDVSGREPYTDLRTMLEKDIRELSSKQSP
jgi:hypothetical protein